MHYTLITIEVMFLQLNNWIRWQIKINEQMIRNEFVFFSYETNEINGIERRFRTQQKIRLFRINGSFIQEKVLIVST